MWHPGQALDPPNRGNVVGVDVGGAVSGERSYRLEDIGFGGEIEFSADVDVD